MQHCPTCQTVQPTNIQCPQRESQPNLTTYNNRDLFPYYYYYPAIFIHNILHHLWEYFGIYPEKNHNKNWDKDHFDNTTKGGPHGNMIRAIVEMCKKNNISDNWEQQSQHLWCNLFCYQNLLQPKGAGKIMKSNEMRRNVMERGGRSQCNVM